MKTDLISVTDHIKEFTIEKQILGGYFDEKFLKKPQLFLSGIKKLIKFFFENHPSIRAIVRYGVGYDNIDLEFCKNKNIIVANTPDYGVDEVSDSAMAMILYLTRKIGALNI